MNDYFNHSTNVISNGTRATAAQVNNIAYEIGVGLDKLPTEAHIKRGTINYAADTGSADLYAVSLPYAPASYTDGMEVVFKAANSNTGACSMNVNSLGVKSIKRADGTDPAASEIPANKITTLRYNSTSAVFEIQNGAGYASSAAASATSAANSATAASGSATDASGYAAAASGSATNSANSAIASAASAAAALVSENAAAASAALSYVCGEVRAYAGAAAPTGWLLCYGQAVSRTTYATLFGIVSTTYGSGDGSTTFNVPDLRGRTIVGLDNMGGSGANRITAAWADSLGGADGAETHTLTTSEIPSHHHRLGYDTNTSGTTSTQTFNVISGFRGSEITTMTGAGSDGAHNNIQPSIAMSYIIKT